MPELLSALADGLANRTAWAGAGDGELFHDGDGDNAISATREYVFTEWDRTASSDMEALRRRFDSNGDGKLTAADGAEFLKFKVMVTRADGSQEAMTLGQLGIVSLSLLGDATDTKFSDGSRITGEASFTRADGSTGTLADVTLAAETQSHRVVETVSEAGGWRTATAKAYDTDGKLASGIVRVSNATGSYIQTRFDDNGSNNWYNPVEVRTKIADGERSVIVKNLTKDDRTTTNDNERTRQKAAG